MNSVDTGWVSDEDPVHIAEQKRAEHRFHPPLDLRTNRKGAESGGALPCKLSGVAPRGRGEALRRVKVAPLESLRPHFDAPASSAVARRGGSALLVVASPCLVKGHRRPPRDPLAGVHSFG
jgi:hypothetical protein